MLTAGINMLNKIYEGTQCVCERVFLCVCVSAGVTVLFSLSLYPTLYLLFLVCLLTGFLGLVA